MQPCYKAQIGPTGNKHRANFLAHLGIRMRDAGYEVTEAGPVGPGQVPGAWVPRMGTDN